MPKVAKSTPARAILLVARVGFLDDIAARIVFEA
jgi:hypothetical protein